MNNKRQKKNIVGGDQSAGNMYKTTNIEYPRKITTMTSLIEKYKHEKANDIQFNKMVAELEEYCSPVDDEAEVVGLERKLSDGNFLSYLDFAKKTKEQFAKKIMKYQLYESAQKIFAYILADIYSRFNNCIRPKIIANDSTEVILSSIQNDIVNPLIDKLEDNVLDIFADEINGAIYFLTGKCHIKWKYI